MEIQSRLLDAAMIHVAFDGWSEATFRAACADIDLDLETARGLCPNGAVDLAVAYHRRGDSQMRAALAAADLAAMRVRDRVTFAVRARIEAADKELVRRGMTLFALPIHAARGAELIWGTADAIWDALGDPSTDANWYSKRMILGGVYSAVVLYWLGDDSPEHDATWAFLDRRIEDVMRFEKTKTQIRGNPALKTLVAGADWLLSGVKAPRRRDDLPGGMRNV